jgi:NADP-dependent 3-hydroxy acid dehydrogenase YdfG
MQMSSGSRSVAVWTALGWRAMRALVTGGGRGIGADIARVLARDGWEVVVCARSGAQVEAVAAEIGGEWMQVDVSDRASVQRMVAEAGEVDLLVANAGVSEGHAPRPRGRSTSTAGGRSMRSTCSVFICAAGP